MASQDPPLPRTRGDGPHCTSRAGASTDSPPHVWGWTLQKVGRLNALSPARAGMDRLRCALSVGVCDLSPAHAGMDPSDCTMAYGSDDTPLPRTRGDGPVHWPTSPISAALPRTRGDGPGCRTGGRND